MYRVWDYKALAESRNKSFALLGEKYRERVRGELKGNEKKVGLRRILTNNKGVMVKSKSVGGLGTRVEVESARFQQVIIKTLRIRLR